MSRFLEDAQTKFDGAFRHVIQDISTLRTGRATPALVEDIAITAYDRRQMLKTLASISVPDARSIIVQPWDKSIISDIERSIREANVGLNPVVEGALIRIPIPPLTEETRKEIVKIMHNKLEQGRIQLRAVRDAVRQMIIAAEKNKELTEDERYVSQEKLDKLVKEYNDKIKKLGEDKEAEMMRV
jgi:ribosome recycling factor